MISGMTEFVSEEQLRTAAIDEAGSGFNLRPEIMCGAPELDQVPELPRCVVQKMII
jgi:hypothetical protein